MKPIFKWGYALIGAVFLAAGLAVAGNYPGVPYTSGPFDAGNIPGIINGVIANVNSNTTGLLYSNATVSATGTGTTEQTLYTYTLAANTLATNGQTLRIKCGATTAANANNKTLILYFGTSTFTTTAVASNAGAFNLELLVTRTGAATQTVWGSGTGGTAGLTVILPTATAGTDNLAAATTIKCTGTDGTSSAGDISGKFMTVESLR